jgi:hypothetical protein
VVESHTTVTAADDLEAAVDAAIAACGGDARAAIRALLIAQAYYEVEIEGLEAAVSVGLTSARRA